jgi:hypothetical protein
MDDDLLTLVHDSGLYTNSGRPPLYGANTNFTGPAVQEDDVCDMDICRRKFVDPVY